MAERTGRDQRLPVRLFNHAHRLLERLGRKVPGFVESEEALHTAARGASGHDDFGNEAYRDGLRTLLEAYDRESHLNPFGRMMVRGELIRILANRLNVEHAWKSEPHILDRKIAGPIFILGLPRTGTTALHYLLGQDPGNQVLEYWLAAAPSKRPPRASWPGDPSFKQAISDLKMMYFLDPSLKAIHLMTADGPEECRHLLGQSFTDDTFECNATIPAYSRWYTSRDMHGSYERHRDILKLIGSAEPDRRWVLKYPAHLRHLRTLLDVFPDACIVQTHRDPARVLPSLCSLIAGWRGIYEDNPDRRAIADWQLGLWADTMRDAMEVREKHDPARFFDLSFHDIVSDPVGAVRRMYEHFGLPWTGEGEQRIQSWSTRNPRGKYGRHRYSAQEFGLEAGMMRERFTPYIEHFAIPAEDGG